MSILLMSDSDNPVLRSLLIVIPGKITFMFGFELVVKRFGIMIVDYL